MAVILNAVVRLAPRALVVVSGELTTVQLAIAVGWAGFMLYTEAWRGFHLRFSPRVVSRASGLLDRARPWLVVGAPLVAMGLFYATPVRLWVSRLVVLAIAGLVIAVRLLPDPWRGIVDFGVVLGLAAGLLSIAWHAAQALRGRPMPVAADFPEETA